MEQTAYFLRRPRRIEELRGFGIGLLRPYRIVSTVCLPKLRANCPRCIQIDKSGAPQLRADCPRYSGGRRADRGSGPVLIRISD